MFFSILKDGELVKIGKDNCCNVTINDEEIKPLSSNETVNKPMYYSVKFSISDEDSKKCRIFFRKLRLRNIRANYNCTMKEAAEIEGIIERNINKQRIYWPSEDK